MADSNTGSTAEDNGWVAILEQRERLGKAWSEHLSEHKRLAKNGQYIRIRGRDFRAISISSGNPCGQLRDGNGSIIKESRDIARAIESADRSSPDTEYKPGTGKTEMKIQAFLIREALQKGLSFGHLFTRFDCIFDELLFITDEMRFGGGEVRPDVIAVGRRSGIYFPVLIELKVDRKMTRLEEQLNNAKNILNKNEEIRERFIKFLSAVSKVKTIDYSETLLMLIWPGSESGHESAKVQEARDRGIFMAKYFSEGAGYRFDLDGKQAS